MPKTKPSKSPERSTLAINNFKDAKSIPERLFRSLNPTDLLNDIRHQITSVIDSHGLSTSDPEKLYQVERLNHQFEWPAYIRDAVEAFYRLHQAQESIDKNEALWTAYHLLHAIEHISTYNLNCYGNQILLGDSLLVAQKKGGKASAESRRQKSKGLKNHMVAEARKMLASGKNPRDLVSAIKDRFGLGETVIRETLKEAGVLKTQHKPPT